MDIYQRKIQIPKQINSKKKTYEKQNTDSLLWKLKENVIDEIDLNNLDLGRKKEEMYSTKLKQSRRKYNGRHKSVSDIKVNRSSQKNILEMETPKKHSNYPRNTNIFENDNSYPSKFNNLLQSNLITVKRQFTKHQINPNTSNRFQNILSTPANFGYRIRSASTNNLGKYYNPKTPNKNILRGVYDKFNPSNRSIDNSNIERSGGNKFKSAQKNNRQKYTHFKNEAPSKEKKMIDLSNISWGNMQAKQNTQIHQEKPNNLKNNNFQGDKHKRTVGSFKQPSHYEKKETNIFKSDISNITNPQLDQNPKSKNIFETPTNKSKKKYKRNRLKNPLSIFNDNIEKNKKILEYQNHEIDNLLNSIRPSKAMSTRGFDRFDKLDYDPEKYPMRSSIKIKNQGGKKNAFFADDISSNSFRMDQKSMTHQDVYNRNRIQMNKFSNTVGNFYKIG